MNTGGTQMNADKTKNERKISFALVLSAFILF